MSTESITLKNHYGFRFGDGVIEAGPGTERFVVVLEMTEMDRDGRNPVGETHVVTFDTPERFAEFLDTALESAALSWPGKFVATVKR